MAKTKTSKTPEWQWTSSGVYRAPWESAKTLASWQIRQATGGAYFLARSSRANGLEVMPLEGRERVTWARAMRRSEPRKTGAKPAKRGRPFGSQDVVSMTVRVAPEVRAAAQSIAARLGITLSDVVARGIALLKEAKP